MIPNVEDRGSHDGQASLALRSPATAVPLIDFGVAAASRADGSSLQGEAGQACFVGRR